jgi:Uma2 family endonuclease
VNADEIIPRYTYKDYALWEGYWELINGHPYAMSPSPKAKHQITGKKIIYLLESLLITKKHCDCQVIYELDWVLNDSTIVRPDVMVVCGLLQDDFLRFPPVIIVEILSEATRFKDRSIKFSLYESQGVRYYLMVDPIKESVEIFELIDNKYRSHDTLTSFDLGKCKLDVSFDSIFKY